MLEFDDVKLELNKLKSKIMLLGSALNIEERQQEFERLELEMTNENFWHNYEDAMKISSHAKNIKSLLEKFEKLNESLKENLELVQICDFENDASMLSEIKVSVKELKLQLEEQLLLRLLGGEHDQNDAIITLHAGAGGTEAQDWVEMLYRMYYKWAEKHKKKIRTLDFLDGDDAGLKSISILVEGINSYGLLKSENGIHRLVRISPFDASGRRHTSFAAVEVIPKIDDNIEINIPSNEIRVDVFRASGAGGQHVNKTSSAIRITHISTGIVVTCQNERSQIQNKEMAMKTLRSKLYQIKKLEKLDQIEDIKGVQKEIAWGSQIRSYVFMPYTLVKDHRTGMEFGNVSAVMNGEIDIFINAYLKYINN
ncbi:MAG: peptide chain release factor 2 [Candidatus Improbicoccus devescovinae]|nr:MAG: peptide chain release factor 2 [Candidatus Improbicoccus devescovinae]